MSRVYNFSAGPAMLPEEVLHEAAEEMLDYKGTGMSVMEMSHRTDAYQAIMDSAEQDIRDLELGYKIWTPVNPKLDNSNLQGIVICTDITNAIENDDSRNKHSLL